MELLDRVEVCCFFGGSKPINTATLYRNSSIPLHTRMRAAGMAIPYEFPRLQVTAFIPEQGSFAQRLERAIARTREVFDRSNKVITDEGSRKLIEATQHPPEELRTPPIRRRI